MDIWQKLASTQRPIVLYGMGNGAEIMMKQLEKYDISVSGFFASDDFVRGQFFKGFKVMTFNEAKEKFPDMIVCIWHIEVGVQLCGTVFRISNTDFGPALIISPTWICGFYKAVSQQQSRTCFTAAAGATNR